MAHVVTRPSPPFTVLDGALEVHQVPVWTDNLVWIAVCTATGDAAIVDGPPDAEPVLDFLGAHDLTPAAVWNTHTHGDHVGINGALAERGLLDRLRVFGPARRAREVPGLTDPVDEGDVVRVGRVEGRVLSTEGHLDGHVSFVCGDALFCGDTLFTGGCGYLFDGPPEKMLRSLLRLAELPGTTRVCCAHEYTEDNLRFAWMVEPDNPWLAERIRRVRAVRAVGGSAVPSTLEEERATNPFLRVAAPTILREIAERMPEARLDDPIAAFTALRALKDRKDHRGPVAGWDELGG